MPSSTYALLGEETSEAELALRAKILNVLRVRLPDVCANEPDDVILHQRWQSRSVIRWLRLVYTIGPDGTQQRIRDYYGNISLVATLFAGVAFSGLLVLHTLSSSFQLLGFSYVLAYVSIILNMGSCLDAILIANGVVVLVTVNELEVFICHSPVLFELPTYLLIGGNATLQLLTLLIIWLYVSVPAFIVVVAIALATDALIIIRFLKEGDLIKRITDEAIDGVAKNQDDEVAA
jgi:hypothetical protein